MNAFTEVRTRFAPSPTGYMHVGNLRTALYCYLIARRSKGKFILRIEDTDTERFVEGATELIYKTLAQCHMEHDEGPDVGGPVGPYVQSERRGIYKKYAEELIEKGAAYRCFCGKDDAEPSEDKGVKKYDGRCSRLSPEEIQEKLDAGLPYVIRQKIPREGTTTFRDAVYGDITVPNDSLDDNVLIKSDGLPTYNFANVVDDHLMGITHVVRGSEYLSSAPKYNLLYNAFGWDVPEYIHCPPVMRDAQHKMSKRHGDPSFEDLIEQGYVTDAVINYVALLGWSPGGEREIYSLDELKEVFDISGISKSPAIFDVEKLTYFNGEYIKTMPPEAFYELALPYIRKAVKNPAYNARALAALVQSRSQVLSDIPERIDFFDELPDYDIALYTHKKMKTDSENSLNTLKRALPVLQALWDWSEAGIHAALFGLVETMGVKNGVVLWPLRVAVSGKAMTPGGAVEICAILGKDESIRRITDGISRLS